jgi:predicted RNase H-like HicB family nuclease
VSQGETLEEVKRNIEEALQGCLSVAAEMAEEYDGAPIEEIDV